MAVKAAPLGVAQDLVQTFVNSDVLPSDFSWKAWTYDPALISASVSLNPFVGQIMVQRMAIPLSVSVSQLGVCLRTGGSGTVLPANCWTGLYDKNGQRLGVSSNQSTAWLTAGMKMAALNPDFAGALDLSGGPSEFVWAAYVFGTAPTAGMTFGVWGPSTGDTAPNTNLLDDAGKVLTTGTPPRGFRFGSAQTSLPTSFDFAALRAAGSLTGHRNVCMVVT